MPHEMEYPCVYRPDHPLANHNGMVPKRLVEHEKGDRVHVIGDSLGADLEHMAYGDGRRTDSKSVFRRWTKEAGCIEKGNDREKAPPPVERVKSAEVAQAIQMVKQGYRPTYRTMDE